MSDRSIRPRPESWPRATAFASIRSPSDVKDGSNFPSAIRRLSGNVVTTYQWFDNALNPELLEKIAERTDGKFYRVTDEKALEKVFQEIDRLEKTELTAKEKVRYEERYEKPMKLGILMLALEQIVSRGWWRLLP